MNPETLDIFGQSEMRHIFIIPKEILYRKMFLLHNNLMVNIRQTDLFCKWLENYLDYERIQKKGEFSLETMRFLVERFKHPEHSFNSIHVAGSKGKGSVSTMIAHIIEASGKPSGLYTSPHMLDFSERICTASGPFSDKMYGQAGDKLIPLVESIIPGSIPGDMDPSWFELVTLFAFVTFKDAGLPWAVIETGLGGRLDATNVIIPQATVLTPIELEHTEYLGNSIEKIATEKAGIIKPGIPVFIAEQTSEARKVFERTATNLNCPFFSMEDVVESIETNIDERGLQICIAFKTIEGGAHFERPIRTQLSFLSEIQAKNAALAAYTAKYLFPDMNENIIEKGLSRSWLPGRFEIVSHSPIIVLDGAHTKRSVSLAVETFKKIYHTNAHLVFACAADKDVDSIASLFIDGFSEITVTRPGEKKMSDIGHAEKAFKNIFSGNEKTLLRVTPDFKDALLNAFDTAKRANRPLLVTGSFYLVAEAKKILADL